MAKPNKIELTGNEKYTSGISEKDWEALQKKVTAFSVTGENTITIFEYIGEDPWTGEGFTLKRMDAALRAIGDKPVTIYINSTGGSYYEGLGIYNRILEHSAKVTVKILGIAASAASVIAMAADEILIANEAQIMIHNCSVGTWGNADELEETVSWMREYIDVPMAGIYAARSGMDLDKVSPLMKETKYFTGKDAVDAKFADGLIGKEEVTACVEQEPTVRTIEKLLTSDKSVTRTEARNLMKEIKGTHDATSDAKHDAGETLQPVLAALLETMRA